MSQLEKKLLHALFLLLASLPIFFYRLGDRQVTGVVEARVAMTSREMLRSNEWIVPTMNGEKRLQKPPFAYWLVMLAAKLRGQMDDVSLRLPFALLALGTLFFTYGIGTLLGGAESGLLAAAVLLTSALFIKEGRMASADGALLFCASGAWFFYALALRRVLRAASGRDAARGFKVCLYFFLGLGILAKGPVILVLVLLPIVAGAAFERSPVPLRPFWSPSGLVIFLVLGLSWPVLVIWRLGEESQGSSTLAAIHQWYLESFCKVLSSDGVEDGYKFSRHPGPWYFYVWRLAPAFGLWFFPLACAWVADLRSLWQRGTNPSPSGSPDLHLERSLALLPVLWFTVIVIFFSFVREKKSPYMLPFMAPGALMVALSLRSWYPRIRRSLRSFAGFAALVLLAGLLLCLAGTAWPAPFVNSSSFSPDTTGLLRFLFVDSASSLVLMAAIAFAGSLIFRRLLSSARPEPPILSLVLSAAFFLVPYGNLQLAQDIPEGDLRADASEVSSLLEPGQELFGFGSLPIGLMYYLDRRVVLLPKSSLEDLKSLPPGAGLFISVFRARPFMTGGGDSNDGTGGGAANSLEGPLEPFLPVKVVNPEAEDDKSRVLLLKRAL